MTKSKRKSIKRFHRRSFCALVGICYFVIATNFIYIALDWIAPLAKVVSNSDFPCAGHDCGCMTADQCLSNCCCVPSGNNQMVRRSSPENHCAKKPVTVKVTYISSAQCSGHYGKHNVSFQRTGPHLLVQLPSVMPLPFTGRAFIRNGLTPPTVFVDSPDKIPI